MSDTDNIFVAKKRLSTLLLCIKNLSDGYLLPEDWKSYEIEWFITDLARLFETKRSKETDRKIFQKRYEDYCDKRDILFGELNKG